MSRHFANASETIVTNCDVGPACGMADLVYIALIVLAVAVCWGYIRRVRE